MQRRTWIAVGILVALNVASGIVIAIAAAVAPTTSTGIGTVTHTVSPTSDSTSAEPTTGKPAVTKNDYEIKVKTLSKQCFGSAGCNLEVRLSVAGTSVTKGVPVELTVTGDESGPTVETISLDEDGGYQAPEVALSTRSSATKVKARITDLEIAP